MQRILNNEKPLPSTGKIRNRKIAEEVLAKVRTIIDTDDSYTQPKLLDQVKLEMLIKKINKQREKKPSFENSLYYFLASKTQIEDHNHTALLNLYLTNKISKAKKKGNCNELSKLALACLGDYDVNAETVSIFQGDHTFVLIGRTKNPNKDLKSDINKIHTWHEDCIVLDVLNNEIYDKHEIYKKLKCYRYDQTQKNPHILTKFTRHNKLYVNETITSFFDPQYNETLVDEFIRKLAVIENSVNQYIVKCDIEDTEKLHELTKLIAEGKQEIAEYALQKPTNFSFEKKINKKIKHISRMLIKCDGVNNGEFFDSIIIGTHGLYFSTDKYFKDLTYLFNHAPYLEAMLGIKFLVSKKNSDDKADKKVKDTNDCNYDEDVLLTDEIIRPKIVVHKNNSAPKLSFLKLSFVDRVFKPASSNDADIGEDDKLIEGTSPKQSPR